MSPTALEAYREFESAEKACWEVLLREHEIGRQIPSEALNEAMDRTLAELWMLLGRGAVLQEEVKGMPAIKLPVATTGDCAFLRFLPYFSSGEEALELVGKELKVLYPKMGDAAGEELRLAWDVMVQCQLQRLCAECAHVGECPYGGPASLHARERKNRRADG